MHKKIYLLLGQITFLLLWACSPEEEDFTPKPKGYNRITLPKNEYLGLDSSYPYFFEYSKYAIIRKDSSKIAEPYWIHIIYPKLGRAEIQITYKDISDNPQKKLAELIDDSHRLAAKHLYRADALKYYEYLNAEKKPVLALGLSGEIPSHLQFYTTDSTKHFLRAAIYFRSATENDSLAPLIAFVKKDMMRMIETQKFKH
ncbi:MAG: gliding motility lipoprotein GldD [Thermonemataceae bacterium]|nr:gliding motility lipoprotein GldD [Thermonemataceae bacterium]